MKKEFGNIKLSNGQEAIVDKEDYQDLIKYNWFLTKNGYVVRNKTKKYDFAYMHRLINNTPYGFVTDHINQNKLDNRKSNLRTATKQQNGFNCKVSKKSTSGHTGVYWDKDNNKWRSQIYINGKSKKLGRFCNIEEAIVVRKEAERTYHVV